jgi:hypothetical protein
MPVLPEAWRAIWGPLGKDPEYGDDLFVDLYREFVDPPEADKPFQELTDDERVTLEAAIKRYEEIVASPANARKAFRREVLPSIKSEQAAVALLETSFKVIEEYGDDKFLNSYFVRVENFLQTYSLRYDLRRPFSLHPTLSGIFSSLINELKQLAAADAHLSGLLIEFEDAVRDLKGDASSGRIKTCIQKQFNLAEALGRTCPGVTANTLGDICDQLNQQNVWPHATIKVALKTLYGFRSNYPGLGHGGNQAGVLRDVEMKDLVAVSVLLAGFVPYISQMNSELVYRGS